MWYNYRDWYLSLASANWKQSKEQMQKQMLWFRRSNMAVSRVEAIFKQDMEMIM